MFGLPSVVDHDQQTELPICSREIAIVVGTYVASRRRRPVTDKYLVPNGNPYRSGRVSYRG